MIAKCIALYPRSGYLICRYLMEMLDTEPKEAIKRFEEARGEGFDPKKPVLKGQLLRGLNHCIEVEESWTGSGRT